MSEAFTKLFASITRSTVWSENNETRLVWITMLALADKHGYVGASVPGLANEARVPIAAVEAALAKFLAPDAYSRSKEHDGRRIEIADRGWRLLNYERFRDMRDEDARREYERTRKRDQRTRLRCPTNVPDVPRCPADVPDVPQSPAVSAQAEAETEAEAEDRSRDRSGSDSLCLPGNDPDPPHSPPADGGASAGHAARADPPDQKPRVQSCHYREQELEVFAYWQRTLGKQACGFTRDRHRRLHARLAEGATVERLKHAVDGARANRFYGGDNDRGIPYHEIANIFLNAGRVDQLAEYAEKAANGTAKGAKVPYSERTKKFLRDHGLEVPPEDAT